ncbi:MAG: HAMP domain-containing histidine kinase [Alphaproteobacteria bacterium]|nr:HAMP domain-containing histidine kinase [Alphaproteobacteria bacterium]
MRLIPKSFLGRTILIILAPMLLVQAMMAFAFFDNHWSRVHSTMSRTLAGEIAAFVRLAEYDDHTTALAEAMMRDTRINMTRHAKLNRPAKTSNNSPKVRELGELLQGMIKHPVKIYIDSGDRLLFVDVHRPGAEILTFATSLRRVYSSSVDAFVLWLFISLLIASLAVTPFIIMHTRSIRRIAKAANYFGRGMDLPGFVPTGTKEIRAAANALISMKERLDRYNRTRSDMLNAVSHDLKTPLARMRLGVETDNIKKEKLLAEIDSMSGMIGGYLAFARGELPEEEQDVSLAPMLARLARDLDNGKVKIKLNTPENSVLFYARPTALARAFTNLLQNAIAHAKSKVVITETDSEEFVEVTIDDDGKGIPADKRTEALQPFVRLDSARGGDGGTGLGLTIAKQAVENHGGQLLLENSPLGGLRTRVILPI